MELVSLKLTKKEQKEQNSFEQEKEEFPYGLRIRLDDEAVTKLGATGLKAKQVVTVTAKATVRSINTRDNESKDGVQTDVELQLTDMAIAPERSTKEKAKTLFPSI